MVLRQGEPSFDVAVFHEDFGLTGQGQDNLTNGWNMGTVTSNGTTTRPTSGKLLRSSSSLAQAGYLYGYVSPAFFRYPTATFATDPLDGNAGKVLFPGHGDYGSLLLYDQSVMPVDVAQKIAALAGQGLPIVIVGQVPNAAPNASGGTLAGMSAADAQVQAAMAQGHRLAAHQGRDGLDGGKLSVLRRQRARRADVPGDRRVDADELAVCCQRHDRDAGPWHPQTRSEHRLLPAVQLEPDEHGPPIGHADWERHPLSAG